MEGKLDSVERICHKIFALHDDERKAHVSTPRKWTDKGIDVIVSFLT
jgi:hypothetical protein